MAHLVGAIAVRRPQSCRRRALVEHAAAWEWSSYRATVGREPAPRMAPSRRGACALRARLRERGSPQFERARPLRTSPGVRHQGDALPGHAEAFALTTRMSASTSSRFCSISSCERASRFRRSRGSVFDGRTLKCQSSASTEMPSRCEISPSRGVALLQLLQLQRDVGHRRVQLARQEVRRAERLEDLRQLAALLRDQLEHQQERHDARVGLREVAEVVVPRHLAAERRVLLPHAVLDVRMPDAVDQRHAARALDRLRHRPARPHVVDDLRARLLLEHRLREQRRREVARDELAAVVDEEAAVGVAVERDAEIGALLERLAAR